MRKLAIFIAVLGSLSALVAQLPASLIARYALPNDIAQSAKASGTIWKGRLTGIDGIGPIDFKTFPRNIFSAGPLVEFSSQMSGFQAQGAARPGHLSGASVKGRVTTFSNLDPRLGGLAGRFNLDLDVLKFGENCQEASGTVFTDVLAANSAKWDWQGPELSGPVACENGELILRMSGNEDGQQIDITVRSSLSGVYTAAFNIQTNNPNAALILPLYGFVKSNGGFALTETGAWY